MSEDDGMCDAIVWLNATRITCDRRLGHDEGHGGVYPGGLGIAAGITPVDVEIRWPAA